MIPSAVLATPITLEPREGTSGTGAPVYGQPVELRCRWAGRRRAVRRSDGTDVIASATADIRPGLHVPTESRVTRRDGETWDVLDVVDIEDLHRPFARQLILEGPKPQETSP